MDTCSFQTGTFMKLALRQKSKLSGKTLFFGEKTQTPNSLSLKKPRINYFSQRSQWQNSRVCGISWYFSIIWQLSFSLKITKLIIAIGLQLLKYTLLQCDLHNLGINQVTSSKILRHWQGIWWHCSDICSASEDASAVPTCKRTQFLSGAARRWQMEKRKHYFHLSPARWKGVDPLVSFDMTALGHANHISQVVWCCSRIHEHLCP